ncbi:MAG: hypothetical protein ACOCZW_02870 [Bacteroidota bacterium]
MRKVIIITGMFIALLQYSCSDNIVSECETCPDENGEIPAGFSAIQDQVFNSGCAISGCHAGEFPAGNLNLTEGNSYENLVGKEALGSSILLVDPGNSENSWLIKKLKGDGTAVMPPEVAGGKLPQAVVDSIEAWIDAGAQNN